MKKQGATAGTGQAPPAGGEARRGKYDDSIPVDAVDPSPLNRRYTDDGDRRVLALATEIAERGLLHPINVRAMPGGRYEIICGEGRWRAFRHAGRGTIPAMVHDCDEATAHIMRLSENLHRHDLDPLDEGEGVAALLKLHNGDVKEVNARVKWGESWVRRRAQLVNLSPAWREEIAKADTAYPHIRDKVTHLEEIAALPRETQDALLAAGALQYKHSAGELRRAIALWMRRLDSKPWSYEFDKKTYSGSSGRRCEACMKRTGRKDGELFDELLEASTEMAKGDKSDLCLDPACWAEKTVRFVLAQMDDNPGAYLLVDGHADGTKEEERYGQKILNNWQYVECDANKATPPGYGIEARGVFVCGNRIGKVVDILLREGAPDREEDAARAERSARARQEEERAVARRVAFRKAAVEAMPEDAPGTQTLLILTLWFGMGCHHYDGRNPEGLAWKCLRDDVADDIAEIAEAGSRNSEDDHGRAHGAVIATAIRQLDIDLDAVKARAEELLHAPAE